VIDGLLRAMVERAETEREVDAGRWKQATRLLQKALELSGASRSPEHLGALRAFDRLANLQLHAGQSEAARTTRNELQIHLQKLLPATAQIESAQVEIVRLRASNAVCSGRWGDAAADLQRTVELEPSWKSFLSLAPVLVQAGDTGAYRELCQRALTTLEGSKNKYAFDAAARICWLLPQHGVDLTKAHRMAGQAPAIVANDAGFLPWTELTQGWSEFRAGHFNEAASVLEKSVAALKMDASGGSQPAEAAALAVLSMSRQWLHQTDEARQALEHAASLLGDTLDQPEGQLQHAHDPGWVWFDWLVARIAFREAKALLAGLGAAEKK